MKTIEGQTEKEMRIVIERLRVDSWERDSWRYRIRGYYCDKQREVETAGEGKEQKKTFNYREKKQ